MPPAFPSDDKPESEPIVAAMPKRSYWKLYGTVAAVVATIVLLVPYWPFEGLLLSGKPVTIRAADENDKVYERYFGIWAKDVTVIRNIAVVEGTFTKSTWLSAWLYAVKAGKVEEQNAFTVGRSPNRIGEPIWINMKITLALGESQKPNGRLVRLGSAGETRSGGRGGDDAGPVYNFTTRAKKTLPGKLSSGNKYILYVEGDREFEVSREMSLEEFAARNSGNYFVVVGQLE
jgi:hypothetical protein